MKMKNSKKLVVAFTLAYMISLWWLLPNTAHAEPIDLGGGKKVEVTLSGDTNKVTATTVYTGGSGTISVTVNGYAYDRSDPSKTTVLSKSNSSSTPAGVSASVSSPAGWSFYMADSNHTYNVDGASGSRQLSITL